MVIFSLGFFVVWAVNSINFQIFQFASQTGSSNKPGIINFTKWEWIQQEEGITYILLTGRWWWNHDAPDLTDTLIIAGINPRSQTISMLSIPRDLYVQYPGSTLKWRINGIYEANLSKWEEFAIWQLKSKLWEIIWKDIQYYLNVDFQGFIEIVDTLGGVQVTLEENFVDYEYPDGNLWYRSFILRKWTWNLDWEVALMYARSRHSTSDFDRSLRQQEILSSLRSKIWDLWYFKDRKKIIELYWLFTQYVETDMSLANMISIWLEIRSWEDTKTTSFNINDSCYSWSLTCSAWGFLYLPIRDYFWGASVLLSKWSNVSNLDEFDDINTFSELVFELPEIYDNQQEIIIYNTTLIPLYARSLYETLKPYWFSVDAEKWTQSYREKEFENSILYYNGIEPDNSTLMWLQKILDIEFQKRDNPFIIGSDARIEIFLADDNSF